MVIKNDDLVSQKYQFKNKGVINKYAYDGNVSLKINPFPFIIIDISPKQDKKEEVKSEEPKPEESNPIEEQKPSEDVKEEEKKES